MALVLYSEHPWNFNLIQSSNILKSYFHLSAIVVNSLLKQKTVLDFKKL